MALADVLADSPLAVYLLEDNGSTAVDASGNGRNGTHINDPIRLTCGMAYDGVSDDTELGNAALQLSLTGGTWEAWVYLEQTVDASFGANRDHSGVPNGDSGWILFTTNSGGTFLNEISYRVGNREYFTGLDIESIRAQKWVHTAIAYDAAETRFYLDGVLAHVGGAHSGQAVALPWHVSKNGELPEHQALRMTQLAFFGSKLSAARIQAHASGGSPCGGGGFFVGKVGVGSSGGIA